MSNIFYTIRKRGLIKISGKDRKKFLQNIITNDIEKAKTDTAVYSCLLTPQGKFLHDFFITEKEDTLLLDCEPNERCEDLAKRLKFYALRAEISISTIPVHDIYITIGKEHGTQDPRNPNIGNRSFEPPTDVQFLDFDIWDTLRIKNNIPDGSRDMIPEKSTLLESGIDKLNGISFDKGCYIGQELTARMHYRGLAKKHLHPISAQELEVSALPEPDENITINGKKAGTMRSSNKERTHGLALLKNEFIPALNDNE